MIACSTVMTAIMCYTHFLSLFHGHEESSSKHQTTEMKNSVMFSCLVSNTIKA